MAIGEPIHGPTVSNSACIYLKFVIVARVTLIQQHSCMARVGFSYCMGLQLRLLASESDFAGLAIQCCSLAAPKLSAAEGRIIGEMNIKNLAQGWERSFSLIQDSLQDTSPATRVELGRTDRSSRKDGGAAESNCVNVTTKGRLLRTSKLGS